MHHRIFSHRQRRFAFGLLIACRLLRERGGGMSSSSSRAACHAVNEQQAKYSECCNGQALAMVEWAANRQQFPHNAKKNNKCR